MANTIFSVLQNCASPEADYFDGLLIRTKSGAEHQGTLRQWNAVSTPNLICLTGERGVLTYIERDSIESVSIINPAA